MANVNTNDPQAHALRLARAIHFEKTVGPGILTGVDCDITRASNAITPDKPPTTSTLNITLTAELREFLEQQTGDGTRYATPSEFVSDVLREKMERRGGWGRRGSASVWQST